MSDLMFYKKPVGLDSEKHANIRLKPLDSYAFAVEANSVPLVALEFVEAAKEFPIIFIKGSQGEYFPAALLGYREKENLFIGDEGKWSGKYIPAFIRRYPFAPASIPSETNQMILCIDESAECLNDEVGDELFIDGEKAPALIKAIDFVEKYQQQTLETRAIMSDLSEQELFLETIHEVEARDGASFQLKGTYIIDEKKLNSMDSKSIHRLFKSGILWLIYAHLISLRNMKQLIMK